MRCIDADALRESLDIDVFDCFKCKHGVSICGHCSRGGEFQKACNEIEFAQTIDVAPVVHGRWINGKCDQCGGHAPFWCMATTYYTSDFCPHCGALMDGKGDGNG